MLYIEGFIKLVVWNYFSLFKHACLPSILCEPYSSLFLFKYAYVYCHYLLGSWPFRRMIKYFVRMLWYHELELHILVFYIDYNCHSICIHGDELGFRGNLYEELYSHVVIKSSLVAQWVTLVRTLSSMFSFARYISSNGDLGKI